MAAGEDSGRPVKRRRMGALTRDDAGDFDAGSGRAIEQQDTPVKFEDFVSRDGLLLVRFKWLDGAE